MTPCVHFLCFSANFIYLGFFFNLSTIFLYVQRNMLILLTLTPEDLTNDLAELV